MAYAAYLLVVLIWGSTWYFINFQVDVVPATWGVTYRFGFAALMLWVITFAMRLPLKFTRQEQTALFGTGLCLFGINYLLVYLSSVNLTSGLVAMGFSCMTFWNIFNARLFLKTPIDGSVGLAALLGAAGLALIFMEDFSSLDLSGGVGLSIVLALMAGFVASLGNTIAASGALTNHSSIVVNTVGMTYGSLINAGIAFIFDGAPVFSTDWVFLGSLLHLSLIGTVLSFTLYLWLLRQMGLARPAYIAVLAPLVALVISGIFEDFQWTTASLSGLALALIGNVLIIRSKKPSETDHMEEPEEAKPQQA